MTLGQNNTIEINPNLLLKNNGNLKESLILMTNFSLEDDNDDDDDADNEETLGWHGIRLFDDKGNLRTGDITQFIFTGKIPTQIPFDMKQ